jgi:hypothetical protein
MKFKFNFINVLFLALLSTLFISGLVLAQDPAPAVAPAANQDVAAILLQLVTNWKSSSPLVLAMLGVNLIVGVLKSDSFGNFFKGLNPLLKGLIITILGQVAGMLNMVSSGKSVSEAIVFGLFTSGGAVAIYEAYNLFKKQAASAPAVK